MAHHTRNWALAGVVGAVYLLGSIVLVIGVTRYRDSKSFAPLDYKSPQHVLNPIVHPGDKLIVEAYKCNTSDKPVAVSPPSTGTNTIIRNLDTNELIPSGQPRIDVAVRDPGCPLLHFENTLPPLAPGRYWSEGIDLATEGVNVQRQAWHTEPFEVTDH